MEIVQMLVNAGADVNVKSGFNYTPLMRASRHGHIDIVKDLLQAWKW